MKTKNDNLLSYLKKIMIAFGTTMLISVAFVFLLGYLLRSVPRYENYYFLVPYLFVIFSSLILSFVSGFFREQSMVISLITAGLISIVLIVCGFIYQWTGKTVGAVIGRIVLFVVLSALFTFFLRMRKKREKRTKGKFRFSK